MALPPKSSMGWQEYAACRGTPDPGRFDRLGRLPGEFEINRTKLAMKFCLTCPVREACLAFGMKTRSSGVYGGAYLVGGGRSHLPKPPPKSTRHPKAA